MKYLFFVFLFAIGACQSPKTTIEVLFAQSPVEVFDNTSEGLSSSEKQDLVAEGESESWIISDRAEDRLVVKCKFPSSKVVLQKLAHGTGKFLLLAHTINEQTSVVKIWGKNSAGVWEQQTFLPKIEAKSFFKTDNILPNLSDYDNNVSFRFDPITKYIHAELNLWGIEKFEDKETDYTIALKWNKVDFEMIKSEKKN